MQETEDVEEKHTSHQNLVDILKGECPEAKTPLFLNCFQLNLDFIHYISY